MARVPSIMYSLSKSGFSDQYSYVAQDWLSMQKTKMS